MVKCLDSLVTLYRTMIALCGLLIAVGTSYRAAILGRPTPVEMKALEEKLDFFGSKLPVIGICNIGSIVLIVMLLMMINLTRTGRKLSLPKEPADAGFWWGQFLGPLAPLTIVTIGLLPLAAVGQAQSAVYYLPPNVTPTGFFDYYELPFDGFVIVQLICSVWLWIENLLGALRWNKETKAAAIIPATPPMVFSPPPFIPPYGSPYYSPRARGNNTFSK